ncbi:hypothetical protein HYY72_02385 [Candidatus Woesearchaeota archaeon]|nr:hypothetical protein [Candidatus Woesearchaeota archaeon]
MTIRYSKTKIILAATCIILAATSIFLYILYANSNAEAARARYLGIIADDLTKLAGVRGYPGYVHVHSDFRVVMEGKQINFRRPEFDEKSNFVHMHIGSSEMETPNRDEEDKVIHVEAGNITLGHFFNTLGMRFTSNCFAADEAAYCSSKDSQLLLFVNGERNYEMDNYEIRNKDRILITYGNYSEEEIESQIESVSDYAKGYS